MTEIHQGYQRTLRDRSTDMLPFIDDLLVRRTARKIINSATVVSPNESVRLEIPYTFSPTEREQVMQKLSRRHDNIAKRTSFLSMEVEQEGKKVPGTVIHVEKKSPL